MSSESRNAQVFSTQSGGQQRKTIGKFVEAFEAAGNDIAGLLEAFMAVPTSGAKVQNEVKAGVREALREVSSESEKTLDRVLEALRELHTAKTTKDRERLRIMSILAPIFTRADLIRRGFHVSNDAFANARKHAQQGPGPGAPVPVGGRPRVYTPELAIAVDHFCCRPDIAYANPNYIVAHQSLDPSQHLLLEPEEKVEIQDQYGNPVIIPLRATILSENNKEIPNRILRVSIHTLHQRFLAEHPEQKLSIQGLRTLLPKNVVRRPRDLDPVVEHMEDMDAQLPDPNKTRSKRGRPRMSNSLYPANTELEDEEVTHLEDESMAHMPQAHELVHDLHASIHPEDEDLVDDQQSLPVRKRAKLNEKKLA